MFFDTYINTNSKDYQTPPDIVKKVGGVDGVIRLKDSHSQTVTEESNTEEEVKGGVLEGVWNFAVSLAAGAGQYVDSVFNTLLTIGGYASMYPDAVKLLTKSGGRGAQMDARMNIQNKLEATTTLVAMPKTNELIKQLYADTNSDVIDFLDSVGEGVGYYVASFYLGGKLSNAFGIEKGTNADAVIKNIPGMIGAMGKQSNKVAKRALKDLDEYGHVKKEYLYQLAYETGYAGISYAIQYMGTDAIKVAESSNLVKYAVGYFTKVGLFPYLNETVYSTIEGRDFDRNKWFSDAGSAFIAQTVNVFMDGGFAKLKAWNKDRIDARNARDTEVSTGDNDSSNNMNYDSEEELLDASRDKMIKEMDKAFEQEYNEASLLFGQEEYKMVGPNISTSSPSFMSDKEIARLDYWKGSLLNTMNDPNASATDQFVAASLYNEITGPIVYASDVASKTALLEDKIITSVYEVYAKYFVNDTDTNFDKAMNVALFALNGGNKATRKIFTNSSSSLWKNFSNEVHGNK